MTKVKFPKQTVRDVPISGRTVLLRADYNVPLDDGGKIEDDYRLRMSIPTLRYLVTQRCKVVICAHLGRPGGRRNEKMSLAPVAAHLARLLGAPVAFVPDCVGDIAVQGAKALRPGQVALLENLRFHPGEESNDFAFARKLAAASGAEYFVQDGFGVVHRAHASTDSITQILPSVAGLLLEQEWQALTSAMVAPKRPLVAVLGGAKISDKIAVIQKLISVADKVVIGGAMANTFLKYRGFAIGKSITEDGLSSVLDGIYKTASDKVGADKVDEFIILPSDVAVARDIDSAARRVTVDVDAVAGDEYILDLGSDSIAVAEDLVANAKTSVWSGTLGYAEIPQFSRCSARVALAMAQNEHLTSIVGGGDTADFVLHWDIRHGDSFSHVSTGGSASLDLMSGQPMPGIDALMDCR